jgi:methionine-rich copper-binding protein CopC
LAWLRRPVLRPAAAVLALALLAPGTAAAHAVVIAADPGVGATLAAPPENVTLRFNSRLDHARSRLLLVGPDGGQTVLPIVPAREPAVLEAPLPAIGPGAWRLRWQVLAMDGHITRGDIPFTIQAP